MITTHHKKLYEGKAKILYSTEAADVLLSVFKDDATAFNAQKRGTIQGKGAMNCTISSHLFQQLETAGIPTHFIEQLSETEMHVKAVSIIPIEVVIRNLAAGSLCKQTGLELGTLISPPLVELYYKNDELGDPLLTLDRLLLMKLATSEQVAQLAAMALKINDILTSFFQECGITLVDFKLEFGLDHNQQLILADEISPDTCRLWNQSETDPSRRVMDKDRFRNDLGEIESAYQQVMQRVLAHSL
ncbi:phosphoribosylaminoimidazolesuccinocarboxamide synthase [Phormidium sp. CLA17]|uniref:phosphoribosylaminoimidazolesuccinocarboxamide synthase n=1 Tax=Leptolyngbya sp. Cla-17 TaxID=2803751 RepID=UPI00149183D3|nr:phosphoribosylaminoimidazolesuccinocarboxamide synthase [Leptolyngbya sp. Cla-17]